MNEQEKSYQTTTIRQLKSYPTYQFHAFSNAKCSPEDTFLICILETLKWLHARMKNCEQLPEELNVPLPEDYQTFDRSKLHSFSIDLGFQIEVVYIQKKGIWSFRIIEIDAGANLGTPTERKPVQGRTFSTEIAYYLHKDCVEVGIRTICSEPSDTTENCEVFRPALVKALASNPNVKLKYKYPLDGSVVTLSSNANVSYLLDIVKDPKFDLPILLVAESGNQAEEKTILPEKKDLADLQTMVGGLPQFSFNLGFQQPSAVNLQVDLSKATGIEPLKPGVQCRVQKVKQKKKPEMTAKVAEKQQLPAIAMETLAAKEVGFGIVVSVKQKYFEKIRKELCPEFDFGMILILHHRNIIAQYPYRSYQKEIETFHQTLRKEIHVLPKRSTYSFGSIKFISEARLAELQDKNESNLSNQEKIELLSMENAELKRQLHEEQNRTMDASISEETNRLNQKKIRQLEEKTEELSKKLQDMTEHCQQIQTSYGKASEVIAFYQLKSVVAAKFPTEMADVCDWLEEQLSEYLLVSSKARNLMKKYSGELDVALLCDGLLYLSGYARYKRKEIDAEVLERYAEMNHWFVEPCGAECLKFFAEAYSCMVGTKKYLLDYHIKYGIKSEQLIRIYFCWDDKLKKIIIGSMPEHLPVMKQKT